MVSAERPAHVLATGGVSPCRPTPGGWPHGPRDGALGHGWSLTAAAGGIRPPDTCCNADRAADCMPRDAFSTGPSPGASAVAAAQTPRAGARCRRASSDPTPCSPCWRLGTEVRPQCPPRARPAAAWALPCPGLASVLGGSGAQAKAPGGTPRPPGGPAARGPGILGSQRWKAWAGRGGGGDGRTRAPPPPAPARHLAQRAPPQPARCQ